jgi:transcriptional regulator with XRE-family HTH domain
MGMTAAAPPAEAMPIGRLLQRWRRIRGKSQLALALEAGVSARHLGFLELGRSHPSREMVLLLAGVLDVPLRERNVLLLAAGFAPVYRESALAAPDMAQARKALELVLAHQEPYPAVVMDRHWNMVMTNEAAPRFFARLVALPAEGPPANVVRLMFDPAGLRPFVSNWEQVAESLVRRVHREAVGGVPDEATTALLEEVLSYPGVPARWRSPDPLAPAPAPYVAVCFRKGDLAMDFFSTVTTLGTPQDVTLQEMRIECFFPANEHTEAAARRLAEGTL